MIDNNEYMKDCDNSDVFKLVKEGKYREAFKLSMDKFNIRLPIKYIIR